MSVIKVTAEDLDNLSRQVSAGATNISGELTTLGNQVEAVVGGDWIGMASSQFSQLYAEWKTSAANLNSALEGISGLLASAGQQYQATEDNIKASMAS